MTRSVTRQVEPEWDDDTRMLVEGLDRYENECCPDCKFHKSVIEDFANRHFTWDRRDCPVCASIARYGRVLAQQDDEATPKDQHGHAAWSGPREKRPDDGRHLFLRELTPAEVEQRTKED